MSGYNTYIYMHGYGVNECLVINKYMRLKEGCVFRNGMYWHIPNIIEFSVLPMFFIYDLPMDSVQIDVILPFIRI